MDSNTPDRTHGQAVTEVRFGIEYAELNERYWQRLDTCLNAVQVLCGALALAGAIGTQGPVAGLAGVLMAIVSTLQITLAPARRSIAFRDARMAFHDLNERVWTLQLGELDAALERIRKAAPHGLHSLNKPAVNRVHCSMGRKDALEPLSRMERWAEALS